MKATMQNQPMKPILLSNPALVIVQACDKASCVPVKPSQQKFEGVFPPPCKDRPVAKPPIQQTQPAPAQRPAVQPPAPPVVTHRPPAPPPALPPAPP